MNEINITTAVISPDKPILYRPCNISLEAEICGNCPFPDCKTVKVCEYFKQEYLRKTGKIYRRRKDACN